MPRYGRSRLEPNVRPARRVAAILRIEQERVTSCITPAGEWIRPPCSLRAQSRSGAQRTSDGFERERTRDL